MATTGKAYKAWYKKNRGTVNERRRTQYARDPKYRKIAKKRAAEYRANRRATEGKVGTPIRDVAAEMQIRSSTIRRWEQNGYIPPPTSGGTHRRYTERQIALLWDLRNLLEELGWRARTQESKLRIAVLTSVIDAQWEA